VPGKVGTSAPSTCRPFNENGVGVTTYFKFQREVKSEIVMSIYMVAMPVETLPFRRGLLLPSIGRRLQPQLRIIGDAQVKRFEMSRHIYEGRRCEEYVLESSNIGRIAQEEDDLSGVIVLMGWSQGRWILPCCA
jgi:hypothetical protein